MIKSLKLKNFQSHKDTNLTFHPGFNIITGASDSGKSGLIRALRLLIENKPSGWDYKSWFNNTKETEVSIEIDDSSITRRRTASKNTYEVNGSVFEAMGRNVPDAVKSILQMDATNLQTQHDKYFMLQSTPSEVASMLNEVAGLEIIDKVMSNIDQIVRNTKSTLDNQKAQNTKTSDALQKYEYLDIAEPVLKQFCLSTTEVKTLQDTLVFLSSKLTEYSTYETKDKELKEYLDEIEPLYQKLDRSIREINTLEENKKSLQNTLIRYSELEKRVKSFDSLLNLEPSYLTAQTLIQEVMLATSTRKKLLSLVSDYLIYTQSRLKATQSIEKLEDEYQDLLKKEKICPVCGNPIRRLTR